MGILITGLKYGTAIFGINIVFRADKSFLFYFFFQREDWATLNYAVGLLLALYSGITPGGVWRSYGMLEFKPWLDMCKVKALEAIQAVSQVSSDFHFLL